MLVEIKKHIGALLMGWCAMISPAFAQDEDEKYCISNASFNVIDIFRQNGSLINELGKGYISLVEATDFPITVTWCLTPDGSCGSDVLILDPNMDGGFKVAKYVIWGSKDKFWWTKQLTCPGF
jgi:hypothetical protein